MLIWLQICFNFYHERIHELIFEMLWNYRFLRVFVHFQGFFPTVWHIFREKSILIFHFKIVSLFHDYYCIFTRNILRTRNEYSV